MADPLLIFASARGEGNTRKAVEKVIMNHSVEFVDLREKSIHYYDYNNPHEDDDFFLLAERMTKASTIIFATPVYWYSMSAILKTFFDRFTDLITVRKDLGRALAQKACYVIATGAAKELPEGFEQPFSATCAYLNMEYKGCYYYYTGNEKAIHIDQDESAKRFGDKIF